MPGQQFDELVPVTNQGLLNDTATPNVPTDQGFSFAQNARWDVILLANSDTIAHTVGLCHAAATPNSNYGEVTVPAGAGFAGVPPVDFLHEIFGDVFHYLYIASGQTLYMYVGETINTGKVVLLNAMGGLL